MNLTLVWDNEQQELEISDALVSKLELLLQKAGEHEQVSEGEVALTFVDDERIHELNKEYRGIDRPTDVLSFAMNETGDGEPEIVYELEEGEEPTGSQGEQGDEPGLDIPELLGDIIISIPTAQRQSAEYGHSLEREIGFLFVHGFLHLLGYDHEDDASEKEMFAKQERILQEAGLTR